MPQTVIVRLGLAPPMTADDPSAADILAGIDKRLSAVGTWPFVAGVGAFATAALFLGGSTYLQLAGLLIGIVTIALSVVLFLRDRARFTTVLSYDLEGEASRAFDEFRQEFDSMATAYKKMYIQTTSKIDDWKRHGGADFEIKASAAQFGYGPPARIQTNIPIPHISHGSGTIYFLPDILMVIRYRSVNIFDYGNIVIEFHNQPYHENDGVPSDAEIVGSTWRFVRRDGGPDRRFNNNREIPIVNYQAMVINGPGEFQRVFYLSKNADRGHFWSAVQALGGLRAVRTISPDESGRSPQTSAAHALPTNTSR